MHSAAAGRCLSLGWLGAAGLALQVSLEDMLELNELNDTDALQPNFKVRPAGCVFVAPDERRRADPLGWEAGMHRPERPPLPTFAVACHVGCCCQLTRQTSNTEPGWALIPVCCVCCAGVLQLKIPEWNETCPPEGIPAVVPADTVE